MTGAESQRWLGLSPAKRVIQAKETPRVRHQRERQPGSRRGHWTVSVAEPRLQRPVRGRRWGLESKSAKPGAKRRPGPVHGRLLHGALVRLATEIVMAV